MSIPWVTFACTRRNSIDRRSTSAIIQQMSHRVSVSRLSRETSALDYIARKASVNDWINIASGIRRDFGKRHWLTIFATPRKSVTPRAERPSFAFYATGTWRSWCHAEMQLFARADGEPDGYPVDSKIRSNGWSRVSLTTRIKVSQRQRLWPGKVFATWRFYRMHYAVVVLHSDAN